jgi:hypothetical protein
MLVRILGTHNKLWSCVAMTITGCHNQRNSVKAPSNCSFTWMRQHCIRKIVNSRTRKKTFIRDTGTDVYARQLASVRRAHLAAMDPDKIYFAGARYPTIDDFCAGTPSKSSHSNRA